MTLVIIAILIGILVEIAQGYLTTNRQADIFDALANSFGALFGAFAASEFHQKLNNVAKLK